MVFIELYTAFKINILILISTYKHKRLNWGFANVTESFFLYLYTTLNKHIIRFTRAFSFLIHLTLYVETVKYNTFHHHKFLVLNFSTYVYYEYDEKTTIKIKTVPRFHEKRHKLFFPHWWNNFFSLFSSLYWRGASNIRHTHSIWSHKTHFFCYEYLHVEITYCPSNFNGFSR